MQDYRSLKVWKKAHQLVLNVYKTTGGFPREELFGLVSQIQRAAVSIPTNIDEGSGRGSKADFSRFLQISFGSASELEYEFKLSKDLGYKSENSFREIVLLVEEVKKMLGGLLKSIKKTIN